MASNDPKLLYAINGVSAYHIANGVEESLTPSGPQTLSLLMPPTSYLIPRWDLGPDSGAFTRIEFPTAETRKGIQEDVDTFETILAQCTAFLERAPPPRTGKGEKSSGNGKARSEYAGSTSKGKEAHGEQLPAYNPADFKPGEAYAKGAHSAPGGQIVLVDEEDGSVIGELTDSFQVVDSAVKPGSKDPVEITLPSHGGQMISVAPVSHEVEQELHPAYKKSFLVSNASAASRLIITGSDMVSKVLQNQANSFTQKTQPATKPMTFQPTTKEHIRRINTFTGNAASLSSKTVGGIGKVAQNIGATLGGRAGKGGKKGYDADGKPLDDYKPGILNKSLMAFSTVMDGVEQAGRHLLESTSESAATVVGHRWGPEAGEVTRSIGSGVKNVGLVYIDVTGVSRKAIIKSVAKGMVVGKTASGQDVIVGGGDGGIASEAIQSSSSSSSQQQLLGDRDSTRSMTVVEGKQPSALNGSTAKMLQEIFLALSGHPSPLLSTPHQNKNQPQNEPLINSSLLTPSEKSLLSSLAHLSDLHIKISSYSSQIASSHLGPSSVICRAVAAAIETKYLSSFREKVLQVEAGILKQDAHLVGAYNMVPLTAIVGEFEGWIRRMEWLWGCVKFMLKKTDGENDMVTKGKGKEGGMATCTGAQLMDWLRGELQTGYQDVEDTARGLVRVAEVAWLRQVSAWILYGKLPTTTGASSSGAADFFVQPKASASAKNPQDGREEEEEDGYILVPRLLPSFVTPSTAGSMLFIGRSLNQIRNNHQTLGTGTDHLSTQLKRLSDIAHPIDPASFARTILEIRNFLSRTVLQKLLPLSRVLETLELLRDFFLLRRGDFAMALTQQADEKIRSRWRRADNLAAAAAGYDKRGEKNSRLGSVVVKDGEVAAVLVRTWAALGSMQGEHADEDEGLELARDLLRLTTLSSRSWSLRSSAISTTGTGAENGGLAGIAPTPFRNLLFSVPVVLTMQIPSPLDLFLSQADLQTYTAINSYLMSLRRAHLRLTDLWKITSLRRHHPAPPGPPRGSTRAGRATVKLLRQRYTDRSRTLRSAWATASATIFFLCETEGYLQTEVVAGLSEGFHAWLTGTGEESHGGQDSSAGKKSKHDRDEEVESDEQDADDDIWLATSASSKLKIHNHDEVEEEVNDSTTSSPNHAPKDPQTLATAHRIFLRTLVRRLLLTHQSFTDPLYELLVHIDHLVALMHRLHSVWSAADLEADVGVVDAFVDLEKEEQDLKREILGVEKRVKGGIEGLISELRRLETDLPAGGLGNLRGAKSIGGTRQDGDGVVEEDGGEGVGDGLDEMAMEEEEAFAMREMGEYVPRRVGGVDRLLMKLDFGSWFGNRGGNGDFGELEDEL
ncbi:Spc98 family-domain-containing protein [Rhypophila decipiens]|uniref:Spc98 family-domain-containing protein n=1 Tax=Rhypophila decipiens TaxID=261697 RepID=A0AAN6YFS6_9PEZI|nr:Spc98 family-domain-containing protein [Rhypophila decipiens]